MFEKSPVFKKRILVVVLGLISHITVIVLYDRN